MKRNTLDTPRMREVLSGRNTSEFVAAAANASYNTLLEASLNTDHSVENIIYNCEHSTISAVIIWLQERGCVIPADILSTLAIEAK